MQINVGIEHKKRGTVLTAPPFIDMRNQKLVQDFAGLAFNLSLEVFWFKPIEVSPESKRLFRRSASENAAT